MTHPPLTSPTEARPAHHHRRALPAILVLLAVVVTVISVSVMLGGPRDMHGQPVTADGILPDPGTAAEMQAVADTGTRFQVPSVSLDVPLGELTEARGTVTPPGFTSVYLVRNRSVPLNDAAAGTVFAVTHSLRNGGIGPGNYLIDVEQHTTAIHPGDAVTVDDVTYTVESSEVIAKTTLPSRADIWTNDPGRLIIITCLQNPAGTASTDNLVITARLAP